MAASILLVPCLSAAGAGPISVHALGGAPVPGVPDANFRTNSFAAPIMNDGRVGFRAVLSTGAAGFFVGDPGSPQPFYIQGNPAPGAPTTPPPTPTTNTRLGASGLAGLHSADGSLWAGAPDTLRPIARTGDQAPGFATGVSIGISVSPTSTNWAMNDSGSAAFLAFLSGPGITSLNRDALFVGAPGNLVAAARASDPAPGFDPGVRYAGSLQGPVMINNAGAVAFKAGVSGFDVPNGSPEVIFVGAPGAIQPLFRPNDPAPGHDDGTTMTAFPFQSAAFALNDQGQVAALVGLHDGRTDGTGLVVGTPGDLSMVVRSGDPRPGVGGTFGSFSASTPIALNSAGRVAFGQGGTIWTGAGADDLIPALQTGSGDGLPDGFTLGQMTPGTLAMNAAGQLAGEFAVLDENLQARDAIVGWDPLLGAVLVARVGDTIEIEPGVSAAITQIQTQVSFTLGGDNGLPSYLDDSGQLAFLAQLSNGQQAVLVGVIPAPGAGVLLGMATVVAARRRRPAPGCR